MAWKVDTRLAVLLKTDARNFSQLILSSFLQNNYLVNNSLSIVRIQTVHVDGAPQDFDEILKHSRREVCHEGEFSSAEDWEKHIDWIRTLGVRASQASEFAFKKNLTEGKVGIVQPDLISSKNIEESLLHTVTSPDTPKKKLLVLEKTDEKIQGLKVEYERQELLKSPINPTATFPGEPPANGSVKAKVETPESPKFPTALPAKSPTPSVKSKISVEPTSPKFPTGSPAKSPTPSVKSKISVEPTAPKFPAGSPAKKVQLVSNDKPSIVKMEPKIVKAELPKAKEQKPATPSVKDTTINFLASEKQEQPLVAKGPSPVAVKIPKLESTKPKPLNLPPMTTQEPQQVSQEPPKLQPSKSSHSIRRKKQKLIEAKPPNILVFSDSTTTRDNVIKTLGTILQKSTYTIYPLTSQQARNRIWLDNTTLLVVCGSVNGSDIGTIFLDFFFKGGKVLCLCSDLLRHVLPTYHTAEVSIAFFELLAEFKLISTFFLGTRA